METPKKSRGDPKSNDFFDIASSVAQHKVMTAYWALRNYTAPDNRKNYPTPSVKKIASLQAELNNALVSLFVINQQISSLRRHH